MLRLKDKHELSNSALMLCRIAKCEEEAEKLWSTETNVIDICEKHYIQLMSEAFLT